MGRRLAGANKAENKEAVAREGRTELRASRGQQSGKNKGAVERENKGPSMGPSSLTSVVSLFFVLF